MRKLSCALAALVLLAAAAARADTCPKSAAGAPTATGSGNGNPNADSAGLRRLGAERAAFLDALAKLHTCLGDDAAKATGWTITDVRYFDSDPIVEVDVAASFAKSPQVTVLGSALPNLSRESARGNNVKRARLETTRAARTMAQRNAREALATVFPKSDGEAGKVREALAGAIGGCSTVDVAYWDDKAVSVKLACGPAVEGAEAKPHAAPKVEKHAAK